MNPYIKITVTTFTIWMLCAMINGLLCGAYLSFAHHYLSEWLADILIIFFFSLFFSAPGYFILWIVLLISFARWIEERALFRVALSTGFVLALITGVISSEIFKDEFPNGKFLVALFVILSAMTGIIMHFNHFKKIKINERNENRSI